VLVIAAMISQILLLVQVMERPYLGFELELGGSEKRKNGASRGRV